MRTLSKALLAVIVLLLVLGAAACGGQAQAPAVAPTVAAAAKAAAPTAAAAVQPAAPTVAAAAQPAAPTAAAAVAAKATEAPKAAAPAAPAGKPLVVGSAHDLKTLDPGHAYETAAHMIHKATYDTLVTLGSSDLSKFEPNLAEKWTVSPDGLTYTFTLRKGIKFHSGNEMTAADVKWSWERSAGLKDQPSFLFDAIKSIEARDATTLVVTLSQPDPALLGKLTYGAAAVLDSKTVQAQGGVSGPDAKARDQAQKWLDTNSAGTGPFILKSWTKDSEVVVEKNPNYWKGPAKIDRVIYKNYPQSASAKLALEAGDIDIAPSLSGDQAKALATNANIEIVSGDSITTFFLLANRNPEVAKGVLNKPEVAQAIRYAIDYEGIRDLAGGKAKSPGSIVGYGFLGSWDESKGARRDLAKAKDLLAQAGYASGIDVEMEYPTKFNVAGIDFDTLAQKVQADLAEAGIRVTLKPGELQAALQNYRDGKEALGLWLWNVDYFEVQNYIEFMPNRKVGLRAGWSDATSNDEGKKLRDQALVETDPTKRAQLWGQVQQYLADQGPFISLVQPSGQTGVRKNIKGFVFNPFWQVDPYLATKE